jgi:hypothetical protein
MSRQQWLMVLMGIAVGATAAPSEGGQAGAFVGGAEEPLVSVARSGMPGQMLFVEALDSGRTVEGAPYSAEAITEMTQLLADGNRISERSSVRVTRDSRGRERREHEGLLVGALAVATRLRLRGVHVATSSASQTVVGTAASGGNRAGQAVTTFQWSAAAVAPATLMALPTAAAGGPARVEVLEAQVIEGVKAEGVRNTVIIPAGAIGNELPITTVYERWYSPDLQTVVMSRRSDPRFGETVFRLVNIVRAEPPSDLFTVPTDYRIEEPRAAVRPQ